MHTFWQLLRISATESFQPLKIMPLVSKNHLAWDILFSWGGLQYDWLVHRNRNPAVLAQFGMKADSSSIVPQRINWDRGCKSICIVDQVPILPQSAFPPSLQRSVLIDQLNKTSMEKFPFRTNFQGIQWKTTLLVLWQSVYSLLANAGHVGMFSIFINRLSPAVSFAMQVWMATMPEGLSWIQREEERFSRESTIRKTCHLQRTRHLILCFLYIY